MLNDLSRDLVFALRTLRRNPGFTAVALITLTLGIGANTTVFSVVNALLNFPVPFDEPDRVTLLFTANQELGLTQNGVSADEFLDWKEQSTAFEHLTAASQTAYNLVGDGEPLRLNAGLFTEGFWELSGSAFELGRGFGAIESRDLNDHVVVLSHALWQQRFAADPGVVGRSIQLNGESYTVLGVTREAFFFPSRAVDLWTPLTLERGATPRNARNLFVLGQLRQGVSAADAGAEMTTIAARLEAEHPDSNRGWSVRVQTLRDNLITGAGLALALLYGSITFVLLIACANVANLLLARASAREREIALRSSLGAGRGRVVRQLLAESALLGLLGGALGLLVSFWGVGAVSDLLAPDPNIGFIAERIAVDGTLLLHTAGATIAAIALFGVLPAWQLARSNVAITLKDAGRSGSGGGRSSRTRGLLVAAEVTFALALLGTSGALIRAFTSIYTSDPGFDPDGLLTMSVTLPERDYPGDQQLTGFVDEALARLQALPGVAGASATTILPLTVFPGTATAVATLPGDEVRPEQPNVLDVSASAGYFETVRIAISRGRGFRPSDRAGADPVAIVNPSMAQRFWGDEDPIDRRIRVERPGADLPLEVRIVGVTADFDGAAHSIRNPAPIPTIFLPLPQKPSRTVTMVVRSDRAPGEVASEARASVWAVDANLPIDDVATMNEQIARIDTQNIFFIRVLSGLSLIALLLAATGIYGVVSYSVGRRRQEIGIRMALGASTPRVLSLVLRQAGLLVLIGLALGSGLAYLFVRLLGSQLEGIAAANAAGPATFLVVAALLLAVAQIASIVPARNASKVDPVNALRAE